MKLDKVIAVRTNKTVYRDGHLAIKVFDSDYSKADVLNEALNQARVEETALNIPRLHEVCTVGGKWAIVSDFIPGKTLARLMEENPDRRDEYMDLFVDLQLKMHAQTCPLLGKLKDKMNRKIDETGLDATTRYELHARLQGMPNHKKLCHGDFDPQQRHHPARRHALHPGLVACHAGQRQRRRGPHVPAVLARGRHRRGGKLPPPVLQKERYRPAVCAEVDSHRGRQPEREGPRGGARVPPALGQCGGLRISVSRPGCGA